MRNLASTPLYRAIGVLAIVATLLCSCGSGPGKSGRNAAASKTINLLWYQIKGNVFAIDPVTLSVTDFGPMTFQESSLSFRTYLVGNEMTILSASGDRLYSGKVAEVRLPYKGQFIALTQDGRSSFLDGRTGTINSSSLDFVMGVDADHALGHRGDDLVVYDIPSQRVRAIIKGSPEAWPIQDSRIAVRRQGRWGFVDLDGVEVIPSRYRKVLNFSEGIGAIQLDDLTWRYVRKNGEFLPTPPLDDVSPFSEGVATCSYREMHHLVDTDGKLTAADGDGSGESRSGMIVAEVIVDNGAGTKEGYIGHDGRWKLRPVFDECYRFCGDSAIVKIGKDLWLINRSGITSRLSHDLNPVLHPVAIMGH